MASESVLANIPKGEIAPNIGITDENREGVVQISAYCLQTSMSFTQKQESIIGM
jgi:hypothetical protein